MDLAAAAHSGGGLPAPRAQGLIKGSMVGSKLGKLSYRHYFPNLRTHSRPHAVKFTSPTALLRPLALASWPLLDHGRQFRLLVDGPAHDQGPWAAASDLRAIKLF